MLRFGLNFAVTPKIVPKLNIISAVEKGIRHLPKSSANIIRSKVVNSLNTYKTPKPNLSSEDFKALKGLAKRNNLVITRADKGNCTVILDKDDYEEKILKLLADDNTYLQLKRDPTKSLERKVNKYVYELFKNDVLSQKEYHLLHSSDACTPRIYGLPKVHKPGAPLRPIVPFINSPLYNLSKFFTKILSPLTGKTGHTVKNSYKFVDLITGLKLNDDECFVSFDVVSLFTKIPVDVAKSVIFELLSKDECLQDRTKLCLKELMLGINICLDNTYIQFKNQFYKQIFGVPMGSPISVTIANLVMETVETKALQTFQNPPIMWKRYVDDTFVVLKKNNLETFHEHLNNIEASIKFTLETESNNSLPFLDVLIVKEKSGNLITKLYQKPTHTNRFLNFNSQHSLSQKRGIISTLSHRINSKLITKKTDKSIEMKKLIETLKKNDYPEWFVKQTLRHTNKKWNDHSKEESFFSDERKELVVLPYLAGFTEKITRIFKAFNIKVCTKPIKTIKNILPITKDFIDFNQRTGAIYQIPCKNCSGIYIGETSRSFKTRCSEHKRDLNPRNLAKIDDNNINKKTALVKHVVNFQHNIDFDNSSILAFESDFFKRRFLESFFINNKIITVNDKENCFYNEIYNELK